jgi:hypothetical protein
VNLKYLADALDYWKGGVLNFLEGRRLLDSLLVEPMLSDPEAWTGEQWSLFAGLLRVSGDQIVRHRQSLTADRPAYFQEIPPFETIFLDPDTGLCTSRVASPAQYVFPEELRSLLGGAPNRLLIVYQHVRGSVHGRLNDVTRAIQVCAPRVGCSSYESATAALLFLSQSDRYMGVAEAFRSLLGPQYDVRVHVWRPTAV